MRIGHRRRSSSSSTSIFDTNLRDRIETALSTTIRIDSCTTEQLVNHLKSKYTKYNNLKHALITKHVEKILMDIKRSRFIDNASPRGCSSPSTGVSACSNHNDTSSDEDADEKDVCMSNKDDEDLLKSMLRDNMLRITEKKEEEKKGNVGLKNEIKMFKDFAGISEVIKLLKEEVIRPINNIELANYLGVELIRGILLHGPPGCGKTDLARAIANEARVPFHEVVASQLVSGTSGASEKNIRELFSKAYKKTPSIIFIDEIDSIAAKRENMQKGMECRIVTQLMASMNKPLDTESSDCPPGYVLVIGATNWPDSLDPALRRSGRFDLEICLGVPEESARAEILSVITSKLRVESGLDHMKLAKLTSGFVASDLEQLGNTAGRRAMNRIIDKRETELSEKLASGEYKLGWSSKELEGHCINVAEFEEAVAMVQPSTTREGFSTIPNVTWDDVGGLDHLKEDLDFYIVNRIKFPEVYEGHGVNFETGILLHGPPGCGKTLIAQAVANAARANFIHIKGPDVLNKYLGESESNIRKIFSRARTSSPSIVFFDEIDALTRNRDNERAGTTVVTQLLSEMSSAEQNRGVYFIGATNRIEDIDDAIVRSGRFGKHMYVPLPSPEKRGKILITRARNTPIDVNVDLMAIGKDEACENFSGADLSKVVAEAVKFALKQKLALASSAPLVVRLEHIKRAVEEIAVDKKKK